MSEDDSNEMIEFEQNNYEEEVTEMSDRRDLGKMLLAFLAGGAVGALLGILLAPASGEETRKKIKDASLAAKDKAKEKLETVKIETVNLFARGKEKVEDVKSQIQAAVEAGKEAYRQKKQELQSESEEA